MNNIEVGMRGERIITVNKMLTATYMGSGSLEVYATPAMIALMEAAAVAAIEHLLPSGKASVGIDIKVEHHAATPIGEEVRAQAEVIDVSGKTVVFQVLAWDDKNLIGEGTHTRFIVDIEAFMQRVERA